MTYYFHSYFSLIKSPSFTEGSKVRVVVPSGNFGDILAGWFAKQMGLPADKLVIATNENDILDRFSAAVDTTLRSPSMLPPAHSRMASRRLTAQPWIS